MKYSILKKYSWQRWWGIMQSKESGSRIANTSPSFGWHESSQCGLSWSYFPSKYPPLGTLCSHPRTRCHPTAMSFLQAGHLCGCALPSSTLVPSPLLIRVSSVFTCSSVMNWPQKKCEYDCRTEKLQFHWSLFQKNKILGECLGMKELWRISKYHVWGQGQVWGCLSNQTG